MKEEFFGNERIASSVLPSMTGMLAHIEKFKQQDRDFHTTVRVLEHVVNDYQGYEIYQPDSVVAIRFPKPSHFTQIANSYGWLTDQLQPYLENPTVLELEALTDEILAFTYTSWNSLGTLAEDGRLIIHPLHSNAD